MPYNITMDWQVIFYIDEEGNEPVKDFIYAQSLGAQAEITHVISLLQEFALTLRLPYIRKIGKSSIRELRIHHGSDYYRIFYFAFTGRKFVLLHAFLKKTNKIPNRELEIAIKRMNDYKLR